LAQNYSAGRNYALAEKETSHSEEKVSKMENLQVPLEKTKTTIDLSAANQDLVDVKNRIKNLMGQSSSQPTSYRAPNEMSKRSIGLFKKGVEDSNLYSDYSKS
jgi:hypothetical protein